MPSCRSAETPAGQRQLRYRISATDLGVDEINKVCADVQAAGASSCFNLVEGKPRSSTRQQRWNRETTRYILQRVHSQSLGTRILNCGPDENSARAIQTQP